MALCNAENIKKILATTNRMHFGSDMVTVQQIIREMQARLDPDRCDRCGCHVEYHRGGACRGELCESRCPGFITAAGRCANIERTAFAFVNDQDSQEKEQALLDALSVAEPKGN